ncbi:hypothetical protein MMC24_006699 [Lignoscripta atroalba]|nr:hypothetical protein [Lignoscripta atroalba]
MTGVFEAIGFGLAIASGIDLAIKLGKELSGRVSDLENADSLVQQLSEFGLEPEQKKLKSRLLRGRAVCNDPHVDNDIKETLDKTFVEMQRTIAAATDQLNATLADKGKKRYLFVQNKTRQALEASVHRLKLLSIEFRDTLMEVHTSETGHSATFLSSSTFQTEGTTGVKITDSVRLQHGNLAFQVGKVEARGGSFVLEEWQYNDRNKSTLEGDIRYLAELLSSAHHAGGILAVVGYTDNVDNGCFELVFAVPSGLEYGDTLQSLLRTTLKKPSLNVRISFCIQLAESVLHVHQLNLVHKNLSSANAIVMEPRRDPKRRSDDETRSIYLVSWKLARMASAATKKSGEVTWWKGIYLHPTRQMEVAQEKYNMGHDIYSLGVCMLEILMWRPLVDTVNGELVISNMFKDRAEALGVLEKNQKESRGPMTESQLCTADPKAVRKILIDLAETELPAAAGFKLSTLVLSCLSCLERGIAGVSFADTGKVETGMSFMTSVKSTLAQISV